MACRHLEMARDRFKSRHFIREWRKHRGLTQAQLAERIGITGAYLSEIETGKKRYDQTLLERVADELRCEIPDLVMRDPTQPDALWTIYDQLSPVQRQTLTEIAHSLKKTGT